MRPVSRRHSRRGLEGGSTFRRTPISRSPLDKNPMPGHLSELHPVNAVNTKGQFLRASFGKKPQVPNTARQAASLPGDISRGKRSSMPQPKTRPDSPVPDRKSTRLNSSHHSISYAVFCLKKKKIQSYGAITGQLEKPVSNLQN